MKKVLFAVMAVFAIVMVSCSSSSGYDQATVDQLVAKMDKLGEDQMPSKADYQTALEQLNYALDEVEKSGDPEKFAEKNEKMMESVLMLSSIVAVAAFDDNCPESLKKDIQALGERMQKLN